MPPRALVASGASGGDAVARTWHPRTFQRLQELIADAYQSSELSLLIATRDFFTKHAAEVRAGLSYPGKVEQSRNEIAKNGKAVIDGQEYKGSTAFNYDALCLSDLLSMDEYLASAILLNSQSQIAEFGSRSLLGTGLAMFHTERAAWIECVVLLAQGFANERVSPESRSLFGFMLKHLVGSDKNAGNQLLKTVLAGIDHLHAHIAKLSQIVDAAAPSLPPNPQHSLLVAIGGTATLDDHQGFCEEQLRRLKYAACLLVQRTSISSKDVITLLKRLQQATEPADDYGACAWLVALMRQSPEDTDESIPTMASDSEFLTQSDDAVEKGEWKSLGMRLFVKLAWATYLKGFQPLNAALYDRLNLTTGDRLDQFAKAAVENDVITFIRERFVQGGSPAVAGADIDNDVGQAFFLPNLRTFIERFVQRNLRLLRALKSADDGAYQAEAAQTRLHLSQGAAMSVAQAPATGPRPDFANFIALVGELYRGVFEGGLAFWNDNRLVNFLRLTSEVRAINTRKEVMSMLAALATGTRSSERAFEFLGGSQYGSSAYTALNWNVLFQALQQYAQVLGSSTEKQSLPDQEVELVKGFLSVLTQVVRFNPTARNILSQWRNFDSLVILVLCAVPIGLKAALLEALGAFSVGKGENIAERVWTLIENNQVLQTFNIPINGIMNSGIVNDMEQAEAPAMTFPGTYAFVELLTILMETTGGVGPALDNLGSGRRKPGVWPYVDYVVDLVLLKLKNRGFSDPKERWKLEEACLRFVDVCLSTMNVNVTLSRNSGILSKLSSGDEIDVSSLLYHAGFQIMVKALSGPKFRLLEEVLEVIRGGVDAVNRNQHGTLHFANCVLRGLRIIFKATLHQRDFVSACNTFSTGGIVPPFASQLPSSVTTLDQFFLYRNDVVSKLAGFVGCAVNDEIAWLAVRVLHSLSQTSAFGGPGNVGHPTSSVTYVASSGASRINRLVSIIRQSSDRDVIIQAFADRLDVEDAEDDVPEPENALLETNGMLRHVDGPVSNARFSVRGAILDLLLDNLAPQVVSPSISHLLLGFDVQRSLGQSVLRNPRTDPTTNLNPLHVVVDLIQRGTGGASDRTPSLQQIFWIRHPNLAEKCYHLIYTLCADTQTSTATLQYLRDDDVLASQLRILPSAELARKELAGDEMEGIDAETVVAEADITLCRGWLLRTTALELRSLSQNAETSNLTKLLKVLYLGDTDQDNGRSSGSARMLEVAQALDSSPVDLLALPRGLPVTEADLNAFVYVDPKGCQVYDVQSLATRLSSSTGFQDREVKTLLETVVRRNRQHETYFARRHVTKAWAEIVEVSLGDDCYRLIPVGEKHVLLYDLCATVLPRLADDNTDIEMVDDLSRAILGMIAKLGARGNETAALAGPNSALSVDMLATLLKQLISVLTRPSIKQSTQGDLTNALLCFIQDVTGSAVDVRTTASGKRLAVGEISDEAPGRLSAALVMRQTGALATTFRMINEQSYDKLINLLCSMALDAVEDVWKASALAALDAILALYQLHSNNTEKIVQFMNQRNFLGSLVETVRREDPALQQLIHTYETDSLNSLYIYQQRMSFFARLCLKREGADKVLDNALIEALTDSRVLDMRPEVDATHSAFDHMLAIAERYHSVLLPALRLVATILARIGKEHADVVRRATAFVVAHQDVLLSILKDRSANITMATLEQLEGITLLCSMLAGRGDFGTSNRTGFLHFHLIALLAKYSDTSRWLARLRPVGPAQEELSAQPSVIGKKNQTAFEQKAIRVARSICHNVLSYCQKSVDGRDPTKGFVPVFALSTNIPEDISYAPLTPTLGTLIVYTSNATDDLVQALEDQKRYAAKAAQVSEGRTPAPGDLDEVLGPKASTTLEPALKNRLYAKEVRKMAVELSKDIFALLYIIEHSLLQLYRHIDYCFSILSNRHEYTNVAAFAGRRAGMAGASDLEELERLRRELSSPTSSLRMILDRLSRLDMSQDVGGRQLRSRNTFLQMLLRRSRDLLALDSPSDTLEE